MHWRGSWYSQNHRPGQCSMGTNSTETDQPATQMQLLGVMLRLELWSTNLELVCPHDGPTAKEPPKDMHIRNFWIHCDYRVCAHDNEKISWISARRCFHLERNSWWPTFIIRPGLCIVRCCLSLFKDTCHGGFNQKSPNDQNEIF